MSAAEDEQIGDAAVLIRWSEEAQQYSISSSASDRELQMILPRESSRACLPALELVQYHGELKISCLHMVGKLLTNVDVKQESEHVHSFIASVLPLDVLYRVVAKCLDLGTLAVFLACCKARYPAFEFEVHRPAAAANPDRQWFEDWLAIFRKHWLSWRTATSTATTVDTIYELWREGCSRAGVPAERQAKFEEAVRQFDGQPLSATALHSDAKLLLDAKYTIATALDHRRQQQQQQLASSTPDIQSMLWEVLALAEFFGARLVQEQGLQQLLQLVDHRPEQLQDTLRRWVAKDCKSTMDKIAARISEILPPTLLAERDTPNSRGAPPPAIMVVSAPSLPSMPTQSPGSLPRSSYSTPPRSAPLTMQHAAEVDQASAAAAASHSHGTSSEENTISTVYAQPIPSSALTARESPCWVAPPQPHPYPHDVRLQYQAVLPDGSLEENSTSSESFADSIEPPLSALSSIHPAASSSPGRSVAEELLYQEERRRALTRIRAAKMKAMQQEMEQKEQERQRRERLRWTQIQAAMARVTQSSENPNYLTNCARRPSHSPAPLRSQSPFLRRSSSAPTLNEEAQKAQQLALARVRSKRRQLKLSELKKQQEGQERQQQKWEERNRKIENFLRRNEAAILDQQRQQQQRQYRPRSQPTTPTREHAFAVTDTEGGSKEYPPKQPHQQQEQQQQTLAESLPSFSMYPFASEPQQQEDEQPATSASYTVSTASTESSSSVHVALTIHRAEGLREFLGGCNPYVVSQCAGQKQTSRVLAGKTNPVFDVTFRFEVPRTSKTEGSVWIQVYSRNEFVCDDHVGAADLRFSLQRDVESEHCLHLLADDGVDGGVIYVSLRSTTGA